MPNPGAIASHDLHPGTEHTVVVTGNDLPGAVGNNGLLPGATNWFEPVTATRTGTPPGPGRRSTTIMVRAIA